MDFTRQIEANRRALLNDIDRRIEAACSRLGMASVVFIGELFARMLPTDWRDRWHDFVAAEAASGFFVDAKCADEFEAWIESLGEILRPAANRGRGPTRESRTETTAATAKIRRRRHASSRVPRIFLSNPPGRDPHPPNLVTLPRFSPAARGEIKCPSPTTPGDRYSEEIGVPRNVRGPGRQNSLQRQ